MTDLSSYVNHLPQVLWSWNDDPQQLLKEDDPRLFLGQMLRIFEKILTGIPDGVVLGADGQPYPPLEQMIDELPQLFSSWHTRTDYLPWLAAWVALTLHPTWNEHQQRKAIANIVSIYHLRGLKEGLHAYLDIYSLTQSRPRIAIDDGTAILRARFAADGTARLHAIAHSHTVTLPAVPAVPPAAARPVSYTPVLIHPAAMAVDSNNDYFVVDQGIDDNSDIDLLRRPALWKISSTGELRYGGNGPLPQSLQTGNFFHYATAAVVDAQNRCSVISFGAEPSAEASQNSVLQRFTPPIYASTTVISQATTPKLPVVRPVDMGVNRAGNFVILDRGTHLNSDPPSAFAAKPKIVVVSENPLAVATHPLAGIVEPTAMVMEAGGTLIVTDARNQFASGPDDSSIWEPADLVRVDPANGWSTTSLLSAIPAERNPLVFPTGLALVSPTEVIVCDRGLRWGFKEGEDQSNRTMAEPAALYRVDLAQSPPVITRITYDHALVNPTKLVIDQGGDLIITDRGEALRDSFLRRNWRARPNEFGVIVHFSRQRPTDDDERNRTRGRITNVVEEQKPAHTSWWLKSL